MPVVGTRANASARGYGWSATIPESLDGIVLITPSSATAVGTGSSATIGANGSVTFSSVTGLYLNGVFTTDYDNYMIVIRLTTTGTTGTLTYQMSSNGTANSTTSAYVSQYLNATSTAVSGGRQTDTFGYLGESRSTIEHGMTVYLYGPYLAQPTAYRSVTMGPQTSASIYDYAGTHNQSTSYDGIYLFRSANTFTGLVSVYGLEN